MQIDLKETIKNMLLSRMMQYNSNIASVTVSGVVNEYLDTLTKRLHKISLFSLISRLTQNDSLDFQEKYKKCRRYIVSSAFYEN